ncbi:MAG: alpha/beta hydrolase [Endozoicomonas sp.]|uniref:alpha/beta hydrolase n=1 Tax=Endozoicomonas sp. TaxID=1892382 RepID=UPI003D9BF75B
MSSVLGVITLVVFGIYLCVCLFFFIQQNSFIFPGATNDLQVLKGVEHTSINLERGDVDLSGFRRQFTDQASDVVVLYFGGNAEDVSTMLYLSKELGVSEFYAFNYRGYGSSNGSPSEESLVADGWAQYEYLTREKGISSGRILLMGRSLGSGVAVQLAQQVQLNDQSLSGVILVTPYDSLRAVVSHHFPWLPVRWILRHPFESIQRASHLNTPALFLIASQDQIIPPSHGHKLAQAWLGSSYTEILTGYDHNNLDESPSFYPSIRAFIQKVASAHKAN